jgi:uncharacterized protein (DUF1330 family)
VHASEWFAAIRVTSKQEPPLKTRHPVAVAFLAGITVATVGIQILHAEARPPAYVVAEIDVMDDALYNKGYAPLAAKAIGDAGGKYIVQDGRSVSLFGTSPKRIAIIQFESLKKAEAAFNSPAYKEARKTGDEAANFRIYAIEGVTQ